MPRSKRQATVFFIRQMDRADDSRDTLITSALTRAVSLFNAESERYHLELDRSTLDKPGSQLISSAVLNGIGHSDVIVADLTNVASTEPRPNHPPKSPNADLALAIGYALHAVGSQRLIPVVNEFYDTLAEDFLDILPPCSPVSFTMGPGSSSEERGNVEQFLQDKLLSAIDSMMACVGPSRPTSLHDQYSEWWNRQNEHCVSRYVRFEGLEIWVEAGVFSPEPRLTFSSSLVAEKMIPLIKGKSVLDLGTGSGALAVVAALRGAHEVLAVDIDAKAVDNARRNVAIHRIQDRVRVVEGNLFDNVTRKFDVIVANLPIDPRGWEQVTDDVGGIARKFLNTVDLYLTPKGLALLPWASFGEEIELADILKASKLRFQAYSAETFGVTWWVYEIRASSHADADNL